MTEGRCDIHYAISKPNLLASDHCSHMILCTPNLLTSDLHYAMLRSIVVIYLLRSSPETLVCD
ncbi:hypothetical protein GIB67_037361 [Kingdonia uniflora]|uniref:Uncharacterized protein n=1 Tax=Kingdonia uniflora TaxID=39325 RepID=A0A7J7M8F2_9MAGN|nr:hypothetical protein GIB67_037361 [Kingdonia uniflora]